MSLKAAFAILTTAHEAPLLQAHGVGTDIQGPPQRAIVMTPPLLKCTKRTENGDYVARVWPPRWNRRQGKWVNPRVTMTRFVQQKKNPHDEYDRQGLYRRQKKNMSIKRRTSLTNPHWEAVTQTARRTANLLCTRLLQTITPSTSGAEGARQILRCDGARCCGVSWEPETLPTVKFSHRKSALHLNKWVKLR